MSNTSTLRLHEGKVWERVDRPGLDSAWREVPVQAAAPSFTFMGGKIPWEVWNQIHAQFEWCNREHHCESQCRLFYHEQRRTWKAWFFKQTKTGMTSKELPLDANEPNYQRLIREGFQEFGTWHHHCGAGAFQSGTDHTDEKDRPGLHCTTGGINSTRYTLHTRFTHVGPGFKQMYEKLDMTEFFDIPAQYQSLPAEIKAKLVDYLLVQPPPPDTVFPEEWKTCMVEGPSFFGESWKPGGGFRVPEGYRFWSRGKRKRWRKSLRSGLGMAETGSHVFG